MNHRRKRARAPRHLLTPAIKRAVIERIRNDFPGLGQPYLPGQASSDFAFTKALVERNSKLLQDRSPEGRRELLFLAFRGDGGSTLARRDGIGRARAVAREMLEAALVLADPSASAPDVNFALKMVNDVSVALDGVEQRTLALAEWISASNAAAARWIRTGDASRDDAATCALEWFERRWPMHEGNGAAFSRAVEAWLGHGHLKQWEETANAARAAGFQTNAAHAKKTWQRGRP